MPDDRLYNLLPEYDRVADTTIGGPLQALLRVIAEQVDVVQADIDQLYRNWFIETCADWVVPYIGDLVGYHPLSLGEAGQSTTPEGQRLERASEPRADVARTIATRRRKGTLSVLVEIARDVADWPARAVEFYTLLAYTQCVKHVRLDRGRTVDVRDGDALEQIVSAFERLAHTVDVRRVDSSRTTGRFNIPEVGLFLWRLRCYSRTRTPARCWDDVTHQYAFSILGNDTPLLTLPQPAQCDDPGPLDVPDWIRRRAFEESLYDYCGASLSLSIWRDDPDGAPVPVEDIVPADLGDWTYEPQGSQVAVDPVLGRIVFADSAAPKSDDVWVSYHVSFSADMGGGEYLRTRPPIGDRRVYTVGRGAQFETIASAVDRWQTDKAGDSAAREAVIEVVDSGVYEGSVTIKLDQGDELELRAAPGTFPVILLPDGYSRPGELRIIGTGLPPGGGQPPEPPGEGPGDAGPPLPQVSGDTGCVEYSDPALPSFTLEGFLVARRSMTITGPVAQVTVRHATIVPGWSLEGNCSPEHPEHPSIELSETPAKLVIDHSIVGSIQVKLDEPASDPADIVAHDSVIDSTRADIPAISSAGAGYAYARVWLRRCTVIGELLLHALELGDNSLLLGNLQVARRQEGCVRFCWVEPGSRTPRRYECQPDLVIAAVQSASVPPAMRTAAEDSETIRVRPLLVSERYGTPTYCQLAQGCAREISAGADDQSEMGAFHDLFQPQRLANLNSRLRDFTPAGMDTGVIIVT